MNEQEERELFRKYPEFYTALTCGVGCGLHTITEAVFNWDYHAMNMMPYSEVPERVNNLYAGRTAWTDGRGSEYIPDWLVDAENEILNEYFASCQNSSCNPDLDLI